VNGTIKIKKNKSKKYLNNFASYKKAVMPYVKNEAYQNTIESAFEALNDWSLFYTLQEVKEWFLDKRKKEHIQVKNIPLKMVRDWIVDEKSGNIYHKSGDFFLIRGLRVKTKQREKLNGWDQPILEQVGFDGGLLGIVRQRFEGVPHYLCEAKVEPGNYGKVQISPTLQATFANIKQVHDGRKPHFVDYFENAKNYNYKILFDAWLAEDGGRLNLKRNRGMLIEIDEKINIDIPNDNFIWLSLYQIKELLKEDAWINPHVRGILAHV
jgi:oxidase EvaA